MLALVRVVVAATRVVAVAMPLATRGRMLARATDATTTAAATGAAGRRVAAVLRAATSAGARVPVAVCVSPVAAAGV
ncbi:MAG: hypothetical protein ACR2JO_07830 [Mycobacteriales bacterium]